MSSNNNSSNATSTTAASGKGSSSHHTPSMLTENQRKAQQYLKDHRIEELLGDILNTIAHNQYENPLVYMIKYLAKQVPVKVLEENGIEVRSNEGEDVNAIMQIQFPQFEQACNNIFRQALTRDVYMACKPLQTAPFKNNLRHLIALALENQKHKVGLFATDPVCYSVFKPLFGFAHAALFTKPPANSNITPIPAPSDDFEMQRSAKFNRITSLNQEFKFFEEFTIKIKRNLAEYPFNAAMMSSQRKQIAEQILTALQTSLPKLFTSYQNVETMQVEDRTNLVVQYNKLIKDSNAFMRQGLRFKDWPDHRRIVLSANKKYLVWINREDHFELRCCGAKENNFFESLIQSAQITSMIDEKLQGGFSFDKRDGFRCVKPASTGLATKFKIKVKLPSSQQATFKTNIEYVKKNSPSPFFDIKSAKKDSGRWIISMNRTYSLNWSDLIDATEKYIRALFKSITDKNQPQLTLNTSNLSQYQQAKQTESESQQADEDDDDDEDDDEEEDEDEVEEDEVVGSSSSSISPENSDEALEPLLPPEKKQQPQLSTSPSKGNSSSKYVRKSETSTTTNNNTQTSSKNSNGSTKSDSKSLEQQQKQNQGTVKSSTKSQKYVNNGTKVDQVEITIEEDTSDTQEEKINKSTSSSSNSNNGSVIQQTNVSATTTTKENQQQGSKSTDIIMKQQNEGSVAGGYTKKTNVPSKELSDIISQSKPCVILQSCSKPKEHIKHSYAILRRNFKDIPLKSSMTESDFAKVNTILNALVAQMKEDHFGGDTFIASETGNNQQFETEVKKAVNEFCLQEDKTRNAFESMIELENMRYPLGSFYFKAINLRILGNFDDHLTIIVTIVFDDVIEGLAQLDRLLSRVCSSSGSVSSNIFRCDSNFGYLTSDPRMSGSELSEDDCFDGHGHLVAPEREFYVLHRSTFERNFRHHNVMEKTISVSYAPTQLRFRETTRDIKVSYEIRRNFDCFDFPKFMTYGDVMKLHNHFDSVFSKLPNFLLKNAKEPKSYKNRCYTHPDKYFMVNVLMTDHVGIFSFGKLKELQKSVVEAFELLLLLQTNGMKFLQDVDFGYLSETGSRLGDNFYVKLEMTLSNSEVDVVSKLAKEFHYSMETSVPAATSLAAGSASLSDSTYVTLELKRCGYFLYEMQFIQKLTYTLDDKKDPRKD